MACPPRVSVLKALPINRPRFLFSRPSLKPGLSSQFHLPHSFLGFSSRFHTLSCRRHATNPGRQSPESEPPLETDPVPTTGLDTSFSSLQDRVQIFLAVLFWMSLFFWACAWDGRNNDRPNNGSRFRR